MVDESVWVACADGLVACVQGERVGGKDHHTSIQVEPNCIELNASDLFGSGLEECIAGEQSEVLLTPRDALGNANASFTISGDQGEQTLQVCSGVLT